MIYNNYEKIHEEAIDVGNGISLSSAGSMLSVKYTEDAGAASVADVDFVMEPWAPTGNVPEPDDSPVPQIHMHTVCFDKVHRLHGTAALEHQSGLGTRA